MSQAEASVLRLPVMRKIPLAPTSSALEPLLEVNGLSVRFRTRTGQVHALEDVGFGVGRGEIVGIVGESGSGKSVLSLALMGLLDEAGRVDAGTAYFTARDRAPRELLTHPDGTRPAIAMIFQSPRTALNPIRRVGQQLIDVLRAHEPGLSQPRARARELLSQVKITDPERRLDAYPFELSGGMCQRVMIALALAQKPALLIADEPTTGLDVTTQAAIMELLRELSQARGMGTILITHDLNLAAESCNQIVVMHAGHVVESGPSARLLAHPRHPYTARLIAATPRPESKLADLQAIPGQLPDLRSKTLPACRFSARCERADESCHALPRITRLSVSDTEREHLVACRRPLP